MGVLQRSAQRPAARVGLRAPGARANAKGGPKGERHGWRESSNRRFDSVPAIGQRWTPFITSVEHLEARVGIAHQSQNIDLLSQYHAQEQHVPPNVPPDKISDRMRAWMALNSETATPQQQARHQRIRHSRLHLLDHLLLLVIAMVDRFSASIATPKCATSVGAPASLSTERTAAHYARWSVPTLPSPQTNADHDEHRQGSDHNSEGYPVQQPNSAYEPTGLHARKPHRHEECQSQQNDSGKVRSQQRPRLSIHHASPR